MRKAEKTVVEIVRDYLAENGFDGLHSDDFGEKRMEEGGAMSFVPEGTDAMPGVPMVRVLDEHGDEVLRGWYFRHKNRQPYALDDELHDEDVDHIVVHSRFADWGMEREIALTRITPPHTIEIVGGDGE